MTKVIPALILTAAVTACVPAHKGGGGGGQTGIKPPPSMNFTIKTQDRSDRIRAYSTVGGSQKAGKVRVCIRNTASGRNKGLHFKQGSPKYVVKKRGQMSCGHYSPGAKTFYFWKTTRLGRMKLRAIQRVDLTGFQGQQVTFDWVRD